VASAARRMLAATFALALAAAGIVFAAHALRPDGSAEREHGSGAPADEGPTPNEIAPILDLPS
jgi:hypothetical protein